MVLEFERYRDKLIEILLGENYHERFLGLIEEFHSKGSTKREIYELFLDLHKEIQVNIQTKENEVAYDNLSDFMDGFTSFGNGFKILPEELGLS